MEGGPARWRKVSDAVAGFLRADGKLAPIYAGFTAVANFLAIGGSIAIDERLYIVCAKVEVKLYTV